MADSSNRVLTSVLEVRDNGVTINTVKGVDMARSSKPKELGAAMQQALLRIEKLEQRLQAVFDWIDAEEEAMRKDVASKQQVMDSMMKEAKYDCD